MSSVVKTPPSVGTASWAPARLLGAPDVEARRFVPLVVQLGLLLLVMEAFQVERQLGLLRLLPLLFMGFVVHALLPRRHRLPCFLLLSVASIALVLGVKPAVALLGLGLGLIGLCHLPLPFGMRVALVVGAGAGLAVVRGGLVTANWTYLPAIQNLVLPILGAMFMFRLVIYLYDLRHEKAPASIWERLSYFFMLPNVCFLLFPVIDYQTFRRTYYDADAVTIYAKGLRWMARGVMQLLLYRVVYYHLVPDPTAIDGLGGVVQAMLTTYLLYLRISGQFHLIVGILGLFGFNLPETHHLYFLASSFNDYWRRINIYWKDFMMKIFYYPSLMRLRRWGLDVALVGATLLVFFGTWVLHSYQWFWLRGRFPITGPDALFWGILGGLVVVNALREAKRPRRRARGGQGWDLRAAALLSLKTVGMFVSITVLWSLWSSDSVREWVDLLLRAGNSPPAAFLLLGVSLAALVGVGVGVQYALHRGWTWSPLGRLDGTAGVLVPTAGLVVLLLASMPAVQDQLGPRAGALVASLQEDGLNRIDEARREMGYYEGLLNAEDVATALWKTRIQETPEGWGGVVSSGAIQGVEGLRRWAFKPSTEVRAHGAVFTTNSDGLRDGEYAHAKPPGTYRFALVGASHSLGVGVADAEVYESLVEARLNREHPGRRFEVVNFSASGYDVLQKMAVVEERVFAYEPDVVLLDVHGEERARLLYQLRRWVRQGQLPESDFLRDVIRRADVRPEMSDAEIERRFSPFADDVIRWTIEQAGAAIRRHGALPVAFYVPMTNEYAHVERERRAQMEAMATAAGFLFLSLEDAYDGYAPDDLWLAEWDDHPNALGHRLLADQLYAALLANDARLGLSSPSP